MNLRRSTYSSIIAVMVILAVIALWNLTQPAAAQSTLPRFGAGLSTTPTPLPPTGDGRPASSSSRSAAQTDDGPDARRANVSAPAATFSYYWLIGTAFNPRTTATTYAYNFNGCIYETGGTDNRFMAPLLIPDGSIIKFLRIYYDDTSAANNMTAWITRYQPGVTSEDVTSLSSSGSAGYGTALSDEITHTVDLTNWAYTIIVAPNENTSASSICGIRVTYYAPSIFGTFLPVVQKN